LALWQPGTTPPPIIPGGGIPFVKGDVIRLAGWSSISPAVNIILNLNIVTPDGKVSSQAMKPLAMNTDRSSTSLNTPLPFDGTIVGANVQQPGTAPTQPGQLYVFAALNRTSLDTQVFIAGYLYNGHNPSFPGPIEGKPWGPGRIYNVAPANPSAGAELSITVPTGASWRIISMDLKLVAAAVAVSRTHHVIIDDGTSLNVIFQGNGETPAVTTGQTRDHLYLPWYGVALETAFDAAGFIRLPLGVSGPSRQIVDGSRIRTVSTQLQGADQYSVPQLWVEEWFQN
jgi:hypothetical protein